MNCMHFGVCGGCKVQPDRTLLPYSDELVRKERQVRDLLQPFEVGTWKPILPSPDTWHYRNKMEFAFAVWDDALVLGLRQEGRFDHIINLETCGLMSEVAVQLLKRVRAWAGHHQLQGYHRRRHTGDLRYLILREGKNSKDRMGILLTTSQGAAKFSTDTLSPFQDSLSTLWMGVTDDKSDVAQAKDMRLLWGPGMITERLINRTYQISPFSFFQTNTRGTEILYGLLREWGAAIGGTLIDLYCGSGGITLAMAESFERAIGIDTHQGAIQDAVRNAELNGLENVEFVCEDALEFLKKLPGSKVSIQMSAMVVDPPRVGLHPKALAALLEMNPQKLAYVSCNPESLARDLKSLVPLYRIVSAQPVDLFPHTAHVETVVFMEHR